jgi:hypothetical protein
VADIGSIVATSATKLRRSSAALPYALAVFVASRSVRVSTAALSRTMRATAGEPPLVLRASGDEQDLASSASREASMASSRHL